MEILISKADFRGNARNVNVCVYENQFFPVM